MDFSKTFTDFITRCKEIEMEIERLEYDIFESYLNNNFEKLFRSDIDDLLYDVREYERKIFMNNIQLYDSIIDNTSKQMSWNVMKKIDSKNIKLRNRAVIWIKNYLQSNYDDFDIIECNERDT